MTIDKQKGRFVVVCDACGETEESPTPGTSPCHFDEFWENLKAAGWTAEKVGGSFEHACPKKSCK